jgi:hypothetical protein
MEKFNKNKKNLVVLALTIMLIPVFFVGKLKTKSISEKEFETLINDKKIEEIVVKMYSRYYLFGEHYSFDENKSAYIYITPSQFNFNKLKLIKRQEKYCYKYKIKDYNTFFKIIITPEYIDNAELFIEECEKDEGITKQFSDDFSFQLKYENPMPYGGLLLLFAVLGGLLVGTFLLVAVRKLLRKMKTQ